MLLSLTALCTLLHLAARAGGRLGAMIGDMLLALLGVGAYAAGGLLLVVIAARTKGSEPLREICKAGWVLRQRLVLAWEAGTARELAAHNSMHSAVPLHGACLERSLIKTRITPMAVPDIVADDVVEQDFEPEPRESTVTGAFAGRASSDGIQGLNADEQLADHDAVQAAETRSTTFEYNDNDTVCDYRLPSLTLLAAPSRRAPEISDYVLKATALRLEEKLAGFGIKGKVEVVSPGPVLTLYSFEPLPGTKLAKIRGLEAELSMALSQGVRIVAPLPGTPHVGIEVPHAESEREVVYLREVLEDHRWQEFDATLPLVLGKDPSGQPLFCDLARMPHLLVAGATGAGKSVGLNVMLASLLMKCTPDELRLMLVDPKVVELTGFASIPHLLTPVVSETRDAATVLRGAVCEMEGRYRLFSKRGARDIDAYNARGDVKRLARIVVVVDEFADLMMADAKEKRIETAIARLAQKARAAGIHLILATQRPSVDVITGLIKANLPARIAYTVAQRVDSQTILDRPGAERLLGRGDMLCRLPGTLELQRVHSAYVSEDEIKAICDCLRAQRSPEYNLNILAAAEDRSDESSESAETDPLYDNVIDFVVAQRRCSTSAVQRHFSVGYNRAAKLVERMEREGIVGPPATRAGSTREVLLERIAGVSRQQSCPSLAGDGRLR
jgi:S-DNA-T family DNA segregation ATPase FtsK/SpoIIIE